MDFGKKLMKYREEHDLEQWEIANMIGVKNQTISSYEREITYPTYKKFIKICNILKVDAHYFMEDDLKYINQENLSSDNKKILDKYNSLSDHDKEIVDYIFNLKNSFKMPEPIQTQEPIKLYYFPVFFQSAAAGIGRLSETNDYQMEELKLQAVPTGAKFGMYIEGNSMEDIIYDNDIVLIDPSVTISEELDDEIVVARFGEELVCKRLSVNIDTQTYDFLSENPAANNKNRMNQKRDNFELIGKVVHVIHAHITGNGIIDYY